MSDCIRPEQTKGLKKGGQSFGGFQFGRPKSGHFIKGFLIKDGELSFEIRSVNAAERKANGYKIGLEEESAANLFSRMMINYGDNVKSIRATWYGDNPYFRSNFDSFKAGGSTVQAAQNTFTGKMANTYGFNKALVIVENSDDYVRVLFSR